MGWGPPSPFHPISLPPIPVRIAPSERAGMAAMDAEGKAPARDPQEVPEGTPAGEDPPPKQLLAMVRGCGVPVWSAESSRSHCVGLL